ncbi:MAG: exopolysaccharide biosynthesis polyprenyl glycosylphosphotransferase [Bacteroidetes bacterium]|nr:exopolysaccharide biosynthesis polyprenyl glycosylphosphotransferase [Bacteroidota bacterium]
MQKRRRFIGWYLVSDYLSSLAAWYCLYMFRKVVIEAQPFHFSLPFQDNQFFAGLFIVPEIWLVLHYISGTYTDLYRKSRLQELVKTALILLLGTLFIFFALLLDDKVRRFTDYYLTFAVLYSAQFTFTFLGRIILLNRAKANLRSKRVAYNTLLIGGNQKATEIYEEFSAPKNSFGYKFAGYIRLNGETQNKVTEELKQLGNIKNLEQIVREHQIEEIIIAIESNEHHRLNDILNTLADKNVYIRIIPDMYDILSGTTKMNSIIGEAFIEIPPSLLSEWQRITKRWFDVINSVLALIFISPLLLYVAVRIKLTSRGPIFYTQERLGQYGTTFHIIKFRSMYTNAEQHGPMLTSDDDPRVTSVGKWIRKYRIDELPQFINVLKGEMSIVGPRAERRFFADQIVQHAPYYKHIFKVQPGITSLGMVKYGYASTVEEMVKRLKYDIIYMENMNIVMDFKIIIYTVLTVLYGRGK